MAKVYKSFPIVIPCTNTMLSNDGLKILIFVSNFGVQVTQKDSYIFFSEFIEMYCFESVVKSFLVFVFSFICWGLAENKSYVDVLNFCLEESIYNSSTMGGP